MNLSTQTVRLKRLGVLSVGLIAGAIYGMIGLIAGVIITLISVTASGVFDQSGFGILFGVGSIIFLPIIYGIMGFMAGLITAFVFNLAAKFTGGIEMEFDN